MRLRRFLAVTATAALLAGCGTPDVPVAEGPEAPGSAEEPGAEDAEDPGAESAEEPGAEGPDPLGDQLELEDPNEQVTGDSFRGEGIVLPVPEGWRVDELAFAQGLVLAMPEAGNEQFAGQAVDTAALGQDIDFSELVVANRDQFDTTPSADEEIELEGAARAHLLRFDDLPPVEEGQPEGSLLLLMADDGAGRIAVFNYAAPTDDYDEGNAQLLLSSAGFDPDSEPAPPPPMGEPAPQD